MKQRWAIIAALALPLWLGSAMAEDSDEMEMPTVRAPAVLDTFDAGAYQYQVAVQKCVKQYNKENDYEASVCPIVVNLLKNGRVVDTKALPLSAEINEFGDDVPSFIQMYIWPTWDATLYNHNPTQKVWSFAYEQWYLGVLPRLVKLDDKRVGLLVTQNYGFETVNNMHVLYTEQRGKIKELWSHDDFFPYKQSAVYPVEVKGKPYLLFRQDKLSYPTSERETSLLRWSANKQMLESIKLPTADIPLYAVKISLFDPSPERIARSISCKRNLDHTGMPFIETLTFATNDYPSLSQDKAAMWGNLFFSLEEAKKYQEGLRHCEPPTESEIIKLN